MVGCFAYDSTALVERYVPGMDVAVSVVDLGDGPQALPAVEIVPRDGVYDYAARYTAGLTTWHTPARLASGRRRAGRRDGAGRAHRTRVCVTCPGST